MSDRTRLVRGRILYGFPTCGKTTLERMLSACGVRVIDTDNIIRVQQPEWFVNKMWRTSGPEERQVLDSRVGKVVRGILNDSPHTVVVTNLYGSAFREAIGADILGSDLLLPFGAFRSDPQEVVYLSRRRGDSGGAFPAKLVEKWIEGVEAHRSGTFARLVDLSRFELTAERQTQRIAELGEGAVRAVSFIGDAVVPAWPWLTPYSQQLIEVAEATDRGATAWEGL